MPIELVCSGCGQRLQVREEDAGKQARCPRCQAVSSVPAAPTSGSFAPSPPPGASAQPSSAGNPYAQPPSFAGEAPSYSARTSYVKAHRGGTILTLGIIGLLCCAICAPIAWILGAGDMKAINNGYMDPSGRTQTQVGMILGIIGTILHGLVIVLQIVLAIAQSR